MQGSARRRRSLKPCRSNQIRNPPTKRCVKKTGSIGRRLLGQSPRRASPAARIRSLKPCRSNQIRNPVSGRCVKKTGSIGRILLQRGDLSLVSYAEKEYTNILDAEIDRVQNELFSVIEQISVLTKTTSDQNKKGWIGELRGTIEQMQVLLEE